MGELERAVDAMDRRVRALEPELFLTCFAGCTPCDIVAQLAFRNRQLVDAFEQIRRGQLSFDDVDAGEDYTKVDAEIVAACRSTDRGEGLAELRSSAQELKKSLESAEPDDWIRDGGGEQDCKKEKILLLLANLIATFDHHRQEIDDWEKAGCLVTLVHGTWKPDSPWTRRGSHFRKWLSAESGLEPFFWAFKWSAGNSHKARLEGGGDLAVELERHRRPGLPHFLVGHSHGGNVALYALKQLKQHEWVTGVVCMSTPHLKIRERKLGLTFGILAVLAGLVAAVLFLFATIAPLASAGRDLDSTLSMILGGATILIAVGMIWAVLSRGPKLSEYAKARREELEPPFLCREKLLSVWVPGDKVRGWLKWISKPAEWLLEAWERVARIVAVPAFYALLAMIVFRVATGALGGPSLSEGFQDGVFRIVGVAWLGLAALFVVVVILRRLLRGHPGAWGWESVRDTMLVAIESASPVPGEPRPFDLGDIGSEVETVRSKLPKEDRPSKRHSAVWASRTVVSSIGGWLRDAASSTPPPVAD